MKKQSTLMQLCMMLLMAMLSTTVRAEVVPFTENYSAESTTEGWTSSVQGDNPRFTPIIYNEAELLPGRGLDNNYFLSVNQSERNNNGCIVTGTILSGKAAAGDDFVLEFDMMLNNSSNNSKSQSPVSLQIKDATNQGDIFSLFAPSKSVPAWNVNNTARQVTLPTFGVTVIDEVTRFLWCHYVIARSGNLTYLTITNNATGETVLERTLIEGSSETGGLGNIVFTTKRYYANFAIDNIVVRELQESDVPAVEMSTYTIKYLNETGDEIKSAIVTPFVVGGEATATAEQMTPIYYNDKKYLYKEGNTTITLVADASQNVITLVYREALQCNYTVKAIYGDKEKVLVEGTGIEGDDVTYNYPKYMLDGTTLYLKNQNTTNPYFGKTITLSEENIIETVEYTDGAASDVVFYKEAEQMDGFTPLSTNNADIRCSDGKGGVIDGDEPVVLTTLPAGKYVIYGQVWGTSGYTATITASDATVWELASTGSLVDATAELTLTEETTLYIKDSGDDERGLKMLDLIYIQEAKQHYIVEFNRDEATLTFKKGFLPLGSSMVWDAENTGAEPGWLSQLSKVSTVVFEPSFAEARPTSCASWFKGAYNLTTITGLENLNTSEVTSMAAMFQSCTSLTSLDLSTFDTGNVTDMNLMFFYNRDLTSLNLNSFNTSKVTNMRRMFSECYALTDFDLSHFDTRAVKDMYMMFAYNRMTELDLSSFNTDAAEDLQAMFYNCVNLTTIYVSESWSLPSLLPYGGNSTFYGCQNLVGGNGTAYDEEHTGAEYARIDGGTDMPGYFTKQTSSMDSAKPYAALSNDNTILTFYYDKQISERGGMELSDYTFEAQPQWTENSASIETVIFDESFAECNEVSSTAFWFFGCNNLKNIVGLQRLNTENVVDMQAMFLDCKSLTTIDLSHFNTAKVLSMQSMFNGCNKLISIDLSHFNTSNVRSMRNMFNYCYQLTELDLSNFDTEVVNDMNGMFCNCINLKSVNLANFNTLQVRWMDSMFANCRSLTELDLSSFETPYLWAASFMFQNCTELKTIIVGQRWSNGYIEHGGYMFSNCENLVGGSGTVYDAEHTDAEYARIDGGAGAPGYFTDKVTTGINNVNQDIKGENYYNLKGERLSSPRSGINIVGGRKVIVR